MALKKRLTLRICELKKFILGNIRPQLYRIVSTMILIAI